VGPTETFSPVADHEPWDLTSNVAGVAGMQAGSFRATEQAMALAGIQPSDAVQFVGFSQGGLIATMLAADPSWNAVGLATYGAPAGGIALPDGVSGIAVRNSDDFIPALGGPQLDHHLLQIERQAFAPDTDLPTGLPAPAHQRNAYVATATVIDQARSDAVRDELAALDAFTGDYASQPGATITATTFHAERLPGQEPGGPASSGGSSR
jgi:pimeloyl-ACP methyl ester carboxylesterase